MKRRMKNKLIKQERGAIATLVVFTIFMFIIILSGIYFGITTKQKSQLKSDSRVRDIYGKDIEKIDKIYKEQVAKVPSYDNPYIPNGFTHIKGTWNNGYTIKGVTENVNDEFVWVPCVIDQTMVKEGDNVVTFGKITTEKYNENNLGLLPTNTNVQAEDSSVAEIRKSVEKYGGFYIAKYEAGVPLKADGTKETTENYLLETKTKITEKPLSQEGCGVWNEITREDAITVSKGMLNQQTTGVKSTLISGEAWDTTLQWMVQASYNKDSETNKNYDTNSEQKGWYKDVSNGRRYTTGFYSINNIYDMAGNAWEWTTENCINDGNNALVYRGGSYANLGSEAPAAIRGNLIGDKSIYIAFRVLLYK